MNYSLQPMVQGYADNNTPPQSSLPISGVLYHLFILTASLRFDDQLQFLTPHSGHPFLWHLYLPMSLDFRLSLVTDLHQDDKR